MKKITKRDIIFFLLGILTLFLVDIILNWNDSVNAFKRGWEAGNKDTSETFQSSEEKR